jgi:hypothetical protein
VANTTTEIRLRAVNAIGQGAYSQSSSFVMTRSQGMSYSSFTTLGANTFSYTNDQAIDIFQGVPDISGIVHRVNENWPDFGVGHQGYFSIQVFGYFYSEFAGDYTFVSYDSNQLYLANDDLTYLYVGEHALTPTLNNIDNIDFYAADAGKFLFQYPQYKDKIAVIVLDPPRAGIAPKTLQKVINLDAAAIVYVSCNPSTQARDSIELRNAGYSLEKLSFVDQFPHTSHIESVAMFIKKK